MARDDIATERQWAWDCVRGKDTHHGCKVYDPGHKDAPPLLEPWGAMHLGEYSVCGQRSCRVTSLRPWSDAARERMHKCRCGHTFKSVQGR
ncbi:hypothetical protein [Nitratidesulfovibrio sp. 1201_IL3209]|uniref:hypothetical protein n=1 Tax=Nitratidesulfovibrio sp. 1201_IL3209 TaxID=3084053 RepID=UPI002FD9522F